MKSKFIEIYDNLLPIKIENYILNLIDGAFYPNYPFSLYLNNNLSKGEEKDVGLENSFLTNKDNLGTIYHPLYSLALNQNFVIKNILQNRVFVQLPLKNVITPEKHRDSPYPHWVCLYYINDSDGDTIFYEGDKEIKRASPKKGRIVFFDGSLYHRAGVPTKNNRMIININFHGEFYK